MRNVGGIAQTEAQKVQRPVYESAAIWMRLTGGRGVIFATGTPISNSMVELYTIQRYLQYRLPAGDGPASTLTAWASDFGETVTAIELITGGLYFSRTINNAFLN